MIARASCFPLDQHARVASANTQKSYISLTPDKCGLERRAGIEAHCSIAYRTSTVHEQVMNNTISRCL